jgi:archaellum component FlaC
MAEKTVEELTMTYSRGELDEMAKDLGLDPLEYPNKTAVAKAILAARKGKLPAVKIPEKVGKAGVYAKVKSTEKFIGEFGASVRKLQADIPPQVKENESAVKKIHADIDDQVKENESAVRKIGIGVKELQNSIEPVRKSIETAVKKIHADVDKQVKENESAVRKIGIGVKELQDDIEAYIKDFYYG